MLSWAGKKNLPASFVLNLKELLCACSVRSNLYFAKEPVKIDSISNHFHTTLTKIESGIIKTPSVLMVEKIAKALDVAIKDLIK